MDFNIKKYIQKIKTSLPENKEKQICLGVFNNYIKDISIDSIHFSKNIIFLKDISTIQKTKIKLHKKEVLKKLEKEGLQFRDII